MIDEERLKQCSQYLADALNPVEDGDTFNLDGQEINLKQFLPIVFKHLNKVVLKYPDKAENIFLYLVDAIHYSLCLTDEAPEVTYYSNPTDADMINNHGHNDVKIKVKTK